MSKLDALNNAWRNFPVDRGRARTALLEQTDVWAAEIAERQKWITDANNAFDAEWKARKAQARAELDEAVKDKLREGYSAQSVLHELGSNNTVWIYKLLKEVKQESEGTPKAAEPAPPAPTPVPVVQPVAQPEAAPPTASLPVFQEPKVEKVDLDSIVWRHHDHLGVHGWLLSADGSKVKKYGAEGTDYEGAFFICDTDGHFISGSEVLFDKTPQKEIISRSTMLADLLEGTYKGKIKTAPNMYTR